MCTRGKKWQILQLVLALSALCLVVYLRAKFNGTPLDRSFRLFTALGMAPSANDTSTMASRSKVFLKQGPSWKEGSRAATMVRTSLEALMKNSHAFNFILNEPEKCSVAPELVIVVCTGVTNWDERRAVRETWGNATLYLPSRVVVVFLVGSNPSTEIQQKLVKESRRHQDIIQEDFVDSYMNLTLKSVAMLRWVATFCRNSEYALKSDDDMYIHVPNLLQSLREVTMLKFIMGHMFMGARPKRDRASKWYVSPEHFGETKFPDYVSGTAYAMTSNSAPDLFEASLRLPFFYLEDVFVTGMCARKAGVPRLHNRKFSHKKRKPRGCVFRDVVSGHRNSLKEIRQIHSELMSPSVGCS